MTRDLNPILLALDRAAAALSEAASELTLAMLAAGATPLSHDAYVLSEAIEAEIVAVTMTRLRHTPSA
ncbi:hypothetical protein OM076_13525 [Solirubrobacter ginsenosidimutans]|uniref:Uncharacterized protein n=1 Tax=Solirubrobacter ginsenosidimutans TaxID=490573 RepID=A0A9X3MRY8_9ACTN|nr:hypothetical protein [Solirubrobacter ginsenosidimutans]MDA0161292.1 hypothetical protein [Solirubrobacter ginsenosidimutans]